MATRGAVYPPVKVREQAGQPDQTRFSQIIRQAEHEEDRSQDTGNHVARIKGWVVHAPIVARQNGGH